MVPSAWRHAGMTYKGVIHLAKAKQDFKRNSLSGKQSNLPHCFVKNSEKPAHIGETLTTLLQVVVGNPEGSLGSLLIVIY